MCDHLNLPLTALIVCCCPSSPTGFATDHLKTLLSSLLAASDAAAAHGASLLATHLQHTAALLVCGSDLCSARSSTFAEHVASQLASDNARAAAPARPLLLPICKNGASAPAAEHQESVDIRCHGGGEDDTLMAWQSECMEDDASIGPQLAHPLNLLRLRAAAAAQLGTSTLGPGGTTTARMALSLRGTRRSLCLRLRAAALERSPPSSTPAALLQHSSAQYIVQALDLPPAPACWVSTDGMAKGDRATVVRKGRARRNAAAAPSAVPTATAALPWAVAVVATLSRHGEVAVVAQLLAALGISAAARGAGAVIVDPQRRLIQPLCDAPEGKHAPADMVAALGISVCAVHAAQACVPLLVGACHSAAHVAALLQANALAFTAMQRGLSVANAHAALLLPILAAQAAVLAPTPIALDQGSSSGDKADSDDEAEHRGAEQRQGLGCTHGSTFSCGGGVPTPQEQWCVLLEALDDGPDAIEDMLLRPTIGALPTLCHALCQHASLVACPPLACPLSCMVFIPGHIGPIRDAIVHRTRGYRKWQTVHVGPDGMQVWRRMKLELLPSTQRWQERGACTVPSPSHPCPLLALYRWPCLFALLALPHLPHTPPTASHAHSLWKPSTPPASTQRSCTCFRKQSLP
jgi:hypothetical protein